MKKVVVPIMVYLVREKSKRTGRITFYLRYRDTRSKKIISALGRRLEFYAFSGDDIENLTKAEIELQKAQFEINESGYEANSAVRPKNFIEYYLYVKSRKSASTQIAFNYGMQSLLSYTNNNNLPYKEIDDTLMEGYKVWLKEKYPDTNTAATYFARTLHVYDRCRRDGYIKKDIKIKGIPEIINPKDYLTPEEINILWKTPCRYDVVKNAFIFSCFTGIRHSDWKRAIWQWVEIDPGYNYMLNFKMFKTKLLINNHVLPEIIDMLGVRGNKQDVLFPGLEGLSNGDINREIRRWIETAGLDKHITTHCGRVSFATMIYEATRDIICVQKALGHKNINTTLKYIRIPSDVMKDATLLKGLHKKVDFNKDENKSDETDSTKAAA